MRKVNFIKTLVAKSDYKERETFGDTTFVRFDAEEREDGMMEVVECSVPTGELNEEELKAQYAEWKTKRQAVALEHAKNSKIAEIAAYDTSDKVNGFALNGQTVWLDKATRVGLMNSTTIAKAAGNKSTTLWLGDIRLEVDCDKAIQLLSALEMYALECFNVTAAHKAEVGEMTDISEVERYDVAKGYPEQLKMEV